MPNTCVCLAMVLADRVFREEGTQKVHIAGTFNQIRAASFPSLHSQMALFLAITNVRPGPHTAVIVFCYLDEDETEVLRAEGKMEAVDPLQVSELVFNFRNVALPKPGLLEIAFYLDDEPVQRRKLQLTAAEPA